MNRKNYVSYKKSIKIAPYLFLLPNILIFGTFIIIPMIMGIYYSFTDFKGIGSPKWVGLENYIRLLKDVRFQEVLKNTFVYVFFTMILLFIVSLTLAYFLSKDIKGKSIYRASFYWPSMISFVVVGIMWKWMLSDNFGIINVILKEFGKKPIILLSSPDSARAITVIANVWTRAGYYMIIFIGGLLNIPQELYEAAGIDGANSWNQFKDITFPLLKPTSLVVIILGMIDIFKTYPLVLNLTSGGPGKATTYIVQYIYEVGFEQYKHGYASAMSMLLFIIIATLSAINFKIESKE